MTSGDQTQSRVGNCEMHPPREVGKPVPLENVSSRHIRPRQEPLPWLSLLSDVASSSSTEGHYSSGRLAATSHISRKRVTHCGSLEPVLLVFGRSYASSWDSLRPPSGRFWAAHENVVMLGRDCTATVLRGIMPCSAVYCLPRYSASADCPKAVHL